MSKTQIAVLNPTKEDARRLAVYFWQLIGSPRQFGTEAALFKWADELFLILKPYPLVG